MSRPGPDQPKRQPRRESREARESGDAKNYSHKLAEILQAAEAGGELEDLITDWLTPSERKDLWERWCIIDLLLRGHSQREARDALKVSISKVTRGSRELQYGTGAFRKIWEKIARI